MKYRQLAIPDADGLLFGQAPRPLKTRAGLELGGGLVYPEINFTLPPMEVTAATMPEVLRHYREIISGALNRAVELEAPGVVVEFETVPPMTATPSFGHDIVQVLLEGMHAERDKHGLRSVLRVTPNDNREFARPPVLRSGQHLEMMIELFDSSARAGAELCLIGNVHCGLLDTGAPEEIRADVRRALRQGMPGGGYIFSTSNCIYTGMPLASYELMLEVWRESGNYPASA